jgi:hypothetical protein
LASNTQLNANEPAANNQIPREALTIKLEDGSTGRANNMPIMAQKTAKAHTRGLVRIQKSRSLEGLCWVMRSQEVNNKNCCIVNAFKIFIKKRHAQNVTILNELIKVW